MKTTLEMRRKARRALQLDTHDSVPVQIVEGDQPPKLKGRRYWKTHFVAHGGRFQKTLYTPSSRRIVVGQEWFDNPYENDDH